MMQRPYDVSIVDGLIANSLRRALSVELQEDADPPYIAEALAVQVLRRRLRGNLRLGDGSVSLVAGFRLALVLSCRVLADPLRTQPGGVRRDVERVVRWLVEASENRLYQCDEPSLFRGIEDARIRT